MLFSYIPDAKKRSVTTTRSLTAIASRILVSFLEMICPVNCIIVSTFEADILKKLTYRCRRCIHFFTQHFLFLFLRFFNIWYITQSAALSCWSMFVPRTSKTNLALWRMLSVNLLIKYSGHAPEIFRWDLISATLESRIVLSGGHGLWKFYEIYITLCSQMDMLLRVFAEICMSATLESHIVLSGGHALWKFSRHLFHSLLSSGHQPLLRRTSSDVLYLLIFGKSSQ